MSIECAMQKALKMRDFGGRKPSGEGRKAGVTLIYLAFLGSGLYCI